MRRVLPLVAVVALVAGLVIVKLRQIRTLIGAGKSMQAAGPPPEYVGTAIAKRETWAETLKAVGSVATMKGVTLRNEVPGVVATIRAKSGAHVREGDVIVELDANVERAQLAAATARRELAASTLKRTRTLVAGGALARTQLDADQAAYDVAASDVASIGAQIAHKVVRAPFAGKLGIVMVNPGQYLNVGSSIADLESEEAHFVDFTLPQQWLGLVSPGVPVRLALAGVRGAIAGAVDTIDPTVDPVARAIKLRARTNDPDQELRPGMFVDVSVKLPAARDVVVVPATAIVRAPYGDSVFAIEEQRGPGGGETKIARQHFVRVGEMRGDFVAVDEGVTAGQTIVTEGAFKLRNGARVAIGEMLHPKPQIEPRPENR